jgi:hypothetical protein
MNECIQCYYGLYTGDGLPPTPAADPIQTLSLYAMQSKVGISSFRLVTPVQMLNKEKK